MMTTTETSAGRSDCTLWRVNEVSKLTGVSIRTLQYYDKIGLLHPAKYTEAGYRLYDDAALETLQQILLFRELEFSLKDIKEIISCPDFDRSKALEQQIELLTLKKEHIENLIDLAKGIKLLGVRKLAFDAFDTSKIDEYAARAKASWGHNSGIQGIRGKNQRTDKGRRSENISGYDRYLWGIRKDPEYRSLIRGGAGSGKETAGLYYRAYVYMYEGDLERSRKNVCRRRRIHKKYRQLWRGRYGRVRLAGNRDLLQIRKKSKEGKAAGHDARLPVL